MKKQYLYRGQITIREEGFVLRPGEIVDEDHPAVVGGFCGGKLVLVPVNGDREPPKSAEEAAEVEVEDGQEYREEFSE